MAERSSTDAEPTPRPPRFPWAQLAFCAACLAMAAWLWATYSWCVRVTPADLRAPGAWERLAGRYVEVTGQPTYLWRGGGEDVFLGILDADVILDPDCQGADGLDRAAWVFPRRSSLPSTGPAKPGKALMRRESVELVLPSPSRMTETHRGRAVRMDGYPWLVYSFWTEPKPVVDARMGRFGGEFFAGAAVAAMGALVLTLYLREWLVGRRAAGRDGPAPSGPRDHVA
ncbi:MAG: hypothetical protein ACYS9X_13905 [Planctomycetota bacterium]|jgi:hypothetical protein